MTQEIRARWRDGRCRRHGHPAGAAGDEVGRLHPGVLMPADTPGSGLGPHSFGNCRGGRDEDIDWGRERWGDRLNWHTPAALHGPELLYWQSRCVKTRRVVQPVTAHSDFGGCVGAPTRMHEPLAA